MVSWEFTLDWVACLTSASPPK
uniref:Uncharacterized protein n=1 Tax=Rhizophora mucronata TaxID=61149 RepID=A0A2P2J1P3_RHIMU